MNLRCFWNSKSLFDCVLFSFMAVLEHWSNLCKKAPSHPKNFWNRYSYRLSCLMLSSCHCPWHIMPCFSFNKNIYHMFFQLRNGVAPIDEKMRESSLIWFGHVQRRVIHAPMKKCNLIQVKGMKRDRWRLKITLMEVVKRDMLITEVTKSTILDKIEAEKNICERPQLLSD